MEYDETPFTLQPATLSAGFWLTLLGIIALVGFSIVGIRLSQAQDHSHPASDIELHNKFYSTWDMPNDGNERTKSCCNKRDCYPTPIKFLNGRYYALRREDGMWLIVPTDKLEQNQSDMRDSPDHQSHACISHPDSGNYVYCATLGAGI